MQQTDVELTELEDAETTSDDAMQLLYTGKYQEFSDELQRRPELLRHSDCRFCDTDQQQPRICEHPQMSPFFLIMLTRDEGVTTRTLELIDRLKLWDCAGCALFVMVDFCRSDLACSADELQLARFFASLSRHRQDWCVRLLTVEATTESLTPLEYAAARDCFHLAAAFANAPRFLTRIRDRPTDPRLALQETDLTCYSFDSGDRLTRSPFIKFINSAQPLIGDQIPSGHLCFFNSAVTRAYFTSIAHLKISVKSTLLRFVLYLLQYFGLLTSLTVHIFTRGTFDSSVQVNIPGRSNSTVSYLQLISPTVISAFRYVYYVRLCLQIAIMLGWLLWIAMYMISHYSMSKSFRQNCPALRWLIAACTVKGNVLEGIGVFFFCLQLAIISLEQFVVLDSNSYFEIGGQVFVDGTRLQFAIAFNFYYLSALQLFFISDMANHFQLFFYVLHCMNATVKLVYLTFPPLLLVCCTMLLSQPYLQCSLDSWTCFFEYFGRSFRYAFSLSEFPGISDYLVVWPQTVVFMFVAVFILNFGIAQLTQQICLLQENIEFRQAILVAYHSQQNVMLRSLLSRLLRTVTQRPVVMRRALVRAKVVDGDCKPDCCCI